MKRRSTARAPPIPKRKRPVRSRPTDLKSKAIAYRISPIKMSTLPAMMGDLKLVLLHQLKSTAKVKEATGVIARTLPELALLIPRASVYRLAVGANR